MNMKRRFSKAANTLPLLAAFTLFSNFHSEAQIARPRNRVIEILADHDSRYKIQGLKQPAITVQVGEQIALRITAKKAKNQNRDGSIHGFTLLRARDRQPVPGWDFELKPGTQEFTLAAPSEAGEYVVVCTVICSQDHEGMNMRFVVLP
jgi:heme/copper-type cytochrome/quinol oxidase subunit 2